MTRLTSTPLTPTGSRAEACQPLRAVCAAWQGRDHGAPGGWQRSFGADEAISAPLDSDNAPDCPVNALHTRPACSGYGCRHQAHQGHRGAFTGVSGGDVIGTAHVGGVFGMPTATPPSAGTSEVRHPHIQSIENSLKTAEYLRFQHLKRMWGNFPHAGT